MSLILDALRKMEQDKSSRRGSAQDLRPEVLRYRRAPDRQRGFPVLPVLVAVVLLVGGIGTALLLKSHRASDVVASAPATPAAVAVQPAPAPPAPSPVPTAPAPTAATPAAQPPAPVAAAPEAPPLPARPAASEAAPAKREPEPALKNKRNVAQSKPAAAAERSVKPARRETAPVQAAQQPLGAGSGDITISGIAWQDERGLRRAVLNGSLVGEGATVAGARVVEIKEDRVRLSRNGQLFEVALSSAAGGR